MCREKDWTGLIKRDQGNGQLKVNHVYAAKLIDVDEDHYDPNTVSYTHLTLPTNREV